jgi:membrane protein DedA with SNARE-associated domain
MLGVEEWLSGLTPLLIYLVVGGIILAESMGIPVPGEITLVSASLLAVGGVTNIWGVAIAATIGAIIGDSIGYAIGRRGGRALLERFGRRFPKHFGPAHLARAERAFERWGVWAVFFGRFVALLRILAGPLAGALRVPYRRFLVANATGGIVWAFGTSLLIYAVGRAAEEYLRSFSWAALALAVACGIGTTMYLRRRAARAEALINDGDPTTEPSPVDAVAAVVVEAAHDGLIETAEAIRPSNQAAESTVTAPR